MGFQVVFEIFSAPNARWKDFALETMKLSVPVSCLRLPKNRKVGISALCSPRWSITYDHYQLGWLRTASGPGMKEMPRCLQWCCPSHGHHVLSQPALSQLQHIHLQRKVTQQESPRQQRVNANGLSRQEWVAESSEESGVGIEVLLSLSGLPVPPRPWPQAELFQLSHPFCSLPGSIHCQVWTVETVFI